MDERLTNSIGRLRNGSVACSEALAGAVREGNVTEGAMDVRANDKVERLEPLNCLTRARASIFNRTLSVLRSK